MGTRAGAGGWGLYPGRRARPRLASLAEPPSPAHGPARALRPGSPLLPPLPRLSPSPACLQGILLARILLALPSSPPTSKRAFCLQGPYRRAHPQPWHPHTHPISMGTGRPGPRRSRRGPDSAASAARSRADWAAVGETGDRRVHGRQIFRASRRGFGPALRDPDGTELCLSPICAGERPPGRDPLTPASSGLMSSLPPS